MSEREVSCLLSRINTLLMTWELSAHDRFIIDGVAGREAVLTFCWSEVISPDAQEPN